MLSIQDHYETVSKQASYQRANPDSRHVWFRELYEPHAILGDQYSVSCRRSIAAMVNPEIRYAVLLAEKFVGEQDYKVWSRRTMRRVKDFDDEGYSVVIVESFDEQSFNECVQAIRLFRNQSK